MPVGIPDFFFTKRHSEFLKSEDLFQFGIKLLVGYLTDNVAITVDEVLRGKEVDSILLAHIAYCSLTSSLLS